MATTKKKISEQIQRIYARFLDKENISGTEESFDERELFLLIEQSINRNLKLETFSRFQDGFIDIPRSNIIKYSGIPTVSDAANNRAYAELPAIPPSLPMDMGVWKVSQSSSANNPYIPISSQDWEVMGTGYSNGVQSEGINASFLEQQTGFYLEGKRIYFTKDIKTAGVDAVDIHLLVSDMSQILDTDLLPINADMESTVISDVLQQISQGRISQVELNGKTENRQI